MEKTVEKTVGGQIGGQKLTEGQKEVFNIIKENPAITRSGLTEILNINPSAIQKHIEILKKKNFIKRVGSDKTGHWEIK